MPTKRCALCKSEKPTTEFYKAPRNKDGLYSYCKSCSAAKMSVYQKTPKGRKAVKGAVQKKVSQGYYIFGKGAISKLNHRVKGRVIENYLTPETLESWWQQTPDKCHYCNSSIGGFLQLKKAIISYDGDNFEISKFNRFFKAKTHRGIKWMTLDRADNDKGYQIDNLVKACWICNSIKGDFFDADLMRKIAPIIMQRLKDEISLETGK